MSDLLQGPARVVTQCDDGIEYVQEDGNSIVTTIDTVYSNIIH